MAEQALLAGDPAAFEQLVLQLMSAQNAARQSGEQLFTKLKVQLHVCRVIASFLATKVDHLSSSHMLSFQHVRLPRHCRTTTHRPL